MIKIFDLYDELDCYKYDENKNSFFKTSSTKTNPSSPIENLPEGFSEGGIKQILLEVQYRSQDLRGKAIEANEGGYSCYICGFNFEEKYGDYGKGYIEIHHKNPLHNNKENHFTKVEDVTVVCANCHSVLHHQGKTPMDVELLRAKVIERNKLSNPNK